MSSGPAEIQQEKQIRELSKEISESLDLLFSFGKISKRKYFANKNIKEIKSKIEEYENQTDSRLPNRRA